MRRTIIFTNKREAQVFAAAINFVNDPLLYFQEIEQRGTQVAVVLEDYDYDEEDTLETIEEVLGYTINEEKDR